MLRARRACRHHDRLARRRVDLTCPLCDACQTHIARIEAWHKRIRNVVATCEVENPRGGAPLELSDFTIMFKGGVDTWKSGRKVRGALLMPDRVRELARSAKLLAEETLPLTRRMWAGLVGGADCSTRDDHGASMSSMAQVH